MSSPETIDAEPDLRLPASRGKRLLAEAIDRLLIALPMVPGVIAGLSFLRASRTGSDRWELASMNNMTVMFMVGGGLVSVVLVVVNFVLAARGSSFGKGLFRLHVVRRSDSRSRPGFVRGVLLRIVVPNIIHSVTGGLTWVLDCVWIFGRNRHCLHDLLAGTVVLEDPSWRDLAAAEDEPKSSQASQIPHQVDPSS